MTEIRIKKEKLNHSKEALDWLSENYEQIDPNNHFPSNISWVYYSINREWKYCSYYSYQYDSIAINDNSVAVEFMLRFT